MMNSEKDPEGSPKIGEVLGPQKSVREAELVEHDNRNGQFHRSFTPRQVHVRLALSSITTINR